MAGFALKGFNHTGVIVTDLDRAIGFFRDLLGFELLSRAPRDPALLGRMTGLPAPQVEIAHLQGPGHRVELIRYATDDGRGLRPAQGLRRRRRAHRARRRRRRGGGRGRCGARAGSRSAQIIAIDAGPNQGRQVVYLASAYGLLIEFVQA